MPAHLDYTVVLRGNSRLTFAACCVDRQHRCTSDNSVTIVLLVAALMANPWLVG